MKIWRVMTTVLKISLGETSHLLPRTYSHRPTDFLLVVVVMVVAFGLYWFICQDSLALSLAVAKAALIVAAWP